MTFKLAVAAAALLGAGMLTAVQAQVISFDMSQYSDGTLAFGTTPTTMSPTGDVAGAPGSRVGYWNMVTSVAPTGTFVDDTGAAVSGLTLNITGSKGFNTRNNVGSTTNDYTMYNTVMESDWNAGATLSLTNVPYSSYDVLLYVFPDVTSSSPRGGHITIDGTTYYINNGYNSGGTALSIPSGTDGSGYVLSTSTTLSDSVAHPGNYVQFDNVSGSNLNISMLADDFGDGVPRLKISGFQIVAVPEPSTFAMLGAGLLGLIAIRRKVSR